MSIFSASSTTTRTTTAKPSVLALFGVFAGLSLFGATGCVAEVQAEPAYATYSAPVVYEEPVEYVEAPVNVELYPRVYYGGTYVYYVGGRWYAPGPRGWFYYRNEPRALVSHRVEFERRYPSGYAHVGVHAHVYSHTHVAPGHVSSPSHRSHQVNHASVRTSSSHHHR